MEETRDRGGTASQMMGDDRHWVTLPEVQDNRIALGLGKLLDRPGDESSAFAELRTPTRRGGVLAEPSVEPLRRLLHKQFQRALAIEVTHVATEVSRCMRQDASEDLS